MAPFHRLYPQLEYEILESDLPTLEQNVINDVTELAVSNSPLTKPQAFDILQAKRERVHAVFATQASFYPSEQQTLQLAELEGRPLCISKGNGSFFLQVMAQSACHPQILAYNSYRSTSLAWARTGEAVAIIPLAEDEPREPGLRYLPLADERLYIEKLVFKRRGHQLSPLNQRFLAFYLAS